jgi:hypothetical protein
MVKITGENFTGTTLPELNNALNTDYYSYLTTRNSVPNNSNTFKQGTGPIPYAKGIVAYGTYPEPPEDYPYYSILKHENDFVNDDNTFVVGEGPYPHIQGGIVPYGTKIPAEPPLRAPAGFSRPPQSEGPVSAGYRRDYDRYVGHLDPKYSGSYLATPYERFKGGMYTGKTQEEIRKKHESLVQKAVGPEIFSTIDGLVMDREGAIPFMSAPMYQYIVENEFRITDPFEASYGTPLQPSVDRMVKEFDETLPAQYGTQRNKYSLTGVRQSYNNQQGNTPYFQPRQLSEYYGGTVPDQNINAYTGQPKYGPPPASTGGSSPNEGFSENNPNLGAGTANNLGEVLSGLGKLLTTLSPYYNLAQHLTGQNQSAAEASGEAVQSATGEAGASGTGATSSEGQAGAGFLNRGGNVENLVRGSLERTNVNPTNGMVGPARLANINLKNNQSPDGQQQKLREGDYVLPVETANYIGYVRLKQILDKAKNQAESEGVIIPLDQDTAKEILVNITAGEIVIPAVLRKYIGERNLAKYREIGLTIRKQNEQKEQDASPPPPEVQQPMTA